MRKSRAVVVPFELIPARQSCFYTDYSFFIVQPCPILLICDVDEVEDEEDEQPSVNQPTDRESASTGWWCALYKQFCPDHVCTAACYLLGHRIHLEWWCKQNVKSSLKAYSGSDSSSSGNGLRLRASMKKMRERMERNEIGIVTSAQVFYAALAFFITYFVPGRKSFREIGRNLQIPSPINSRLRQSDGVPHGNGCGLVG